MLNELFVMSRSLSSHGIETQRWHPWLQTFKKADALVAELDVAGVVARVSLLSREEVANLRNIVPDFHNSFPGFNLNCPLLTLNDPATWNEQDALWESALAIADSSPLAYETKDLRRLKRLLGHFPRLEIAPRLKGGGEKLRATSAVLDRLAMAEGRPEEFVHQLSRQIVAASQQGRLPRELALDALYGRPNKKKQQLEKWKATVILDVADLSDFPYRVADPAVAKEWSTLLLRSEGSSPDKSFFCSLSGLPDSPAGDKMPSPNLPVLGPTYLMSMNADAPCQTRYGQTSTNIFRVGRSSMRALNDAILHMAEPTRREKTWAGVPNAFNDRSDLLIAYLEEEPDADVPLVSLFADSQPNPAMALATYESRTADLYAALRRLDRPGRDLHIRVLALSQIDKGRKQIVFAGRYSSTAIYQGRDTWLAGAHNVPHIAIPFPVGKGKPPAYHPGYQPSPAEVMLSFKRQWLRAGQESRAVPGVELGRIYQAFLDPNAANEAGWMLERYVPLTAPLLVGLARSLSGGARLSESARNETLTVIAVYGILLLRQGHVKEVFMEGRDYLLGEFLKFADLLHKLYCQHERRGSIPPQLIGNAAIPMAMQSPRRALEVLSTRMTVYLAWAERFSGEDAGLAKWTRKELGRIADLLKGKDLDARVSANGKAELLLGYLANAKQKESEEELS